MNHSQLIQEQRYQIYALLKMGCTPTQIAEKVVVHKSTISGLANRVHRNCCYHNYHKKIMLIQKKTSPLISIVIPTYNRTYLLVESIESAIKQTYENVEILLICDGSPTETKQIVFEYNTIHPNIRVFFYEDNSGGPVRGRNKGIKEARGKYIAFLDSDDVAEPDRLEVSLKYIEKYRADVVYGGWRAIVDGTRDIGISNGQVEFSPKCNYKLLLTNNVICQSTAMVRTEAIREVGGLNPEMKYREDHELWLRMAYFGYKFKAIKKVLTNLRIHSANLELTHKQDDQYWYDKMLEVHKRKLVL
jgi:glycosyltransferase involved in cell wall biosynthesis